MGIDRGRNGRTIPSVFHESTEWFQVYNGNGEQYHQKSVVWTSEPTDWKGVKGPVCRGMAGGYFSSSRYSI